MNTITITRQGDSRSGQYSAWIDDSPGAGQLDWVSNGDGIRVATHTLVPSALRGRGIAARLVEALIADARREGFRIVPQCSYVAAQFERHPEWAPLRA